KYGWPEDIWFHVDKLSSAHVYLSMRKGLTIEDIPKEVLIDCVQLVKNNSIQGNTFSGPKTGGMDVGQIGFHRHKVSDFSLLAKSISFIVNVFSWRKQRTNTEDRNEKKAQIQDLKKKYKDDIKKKRELDELK
uniref:Coiled-coil domain-containing protein 25 n=1 Tax=Hucho hucho TaxID=62062 RepID=A0A4W5R1A4_9TELE